jgi:hypothetical protein
VLATCLLHIHLKLLLRVTFEYIDRVHFNAQARQTLSVSLNDDLVELLASLSVYQSHSCPTAGDYCPRLPPYFTEPDDGGCLSVDA